MLAIDRKRLILQDLMNDGSVIVSELSGKYDVSAETIRRDLDEFIKGNKGIIRSRGGAYLVNDFEKEPPFHMREIAIPNEKALMAQSCFSMIDEADTIFIDSSTTIYCIAKLLAQNKKKVSVFTDSIISTIELWDKEHINLVLVGGTVRKKTASCTGYMSTDMISRLYSDKAFISCSSLHPEKGLTDNNEFVGKLREQMIKNSSKRILVADSSKFERVSPYKIADLNSIDIIVTDTDPGEKWKKILDDKSIRLVY